jgi:hypothetical protein
MFAVEQVVTLNPNMSEFIGQPTSVAVTTLKQNRDTRLHDYFNAAWWRAPDNGSIHTIPGWNILCDLCCEQDLIYEE